MLQKNWMELIKPSKLDVNVHENDGRTGRLVAEPLESLISFRIETTSSARCTGKACALCECSVFADSIWLPESM